MKSKIDFLKDEMALQKARENNIKLRLLPRKARSEFIKTLFSASSIFIALVLTIIIFYLDPLNFFHNTLNSLLGFLLSSLLLYAIVLIIIMSINYFIRVKKWMINHEINVKWMLSLEKIHGEELMENLWLQYGRSRAAQQLKKIKEAFHFFKENLGKKFNENELTYNRYLNTAYDIYLLVQDNITEVIEFTLDQQKTNIDELKLSIENEKKINSSKLSILEDRLKVYESNELYIEKILDENDIAIQKLTESSQKIIN